MSKALDVQLRLSTTHHPQTDGLSERAVQTFKQYLRIYFSRSPVAQGTMVAPGSIRVQLYPSFGNQLIQYVFDVWIRAAEAFMYGSAKWSY